MDFRQEVSRYATSVRKNLCAKRRNGVCAKILFLDAQQQIISKERAPESASVGLAVARQQYHAAFA